MVPRTIGVGPTKAAGPKLLELLLELEEEELLELEDEELLELEDEELLLELEELLLELEEELLLELEEEELLLEGQQIKSIKIINPAMSRIRRPNGPSSNPACLNNSRINKMSKILSMTNRATVSPMNMEMLDNVPKYPMSLATRGSPALRIRPLIT